MKSNKPNGNIATRTPNDNVIISGEQFSGEDIPSYICNYCNRTLTRLTDRSGKNESWYCNNCSIEFNPEDEQIRQNSAGSWN
jgi:ribosomal protein L37AE/L43A